MGSAGLVVEVVGGADVEVVVVLGEVRITGVPDAHASIGPVVAPESATTHMRAADRRADGTGNLNVNGLGFEGHGRMPAPNDCGTKPYQGLRSENSAKATGRR